MYVIDVGVTFGGLTQLVVPTVVNIWMSMSGPDGSDASLLKSAGESSCREP
jgi:hypothetical protein